MCAYRKTFEAPNHKAQVYGESKEQSGKCSRVASVSFSFNDDYNVSNIKSGLVSSLLMSGEGFELYPCGDECLNIILPNSNADFFVTFYDDEKSVAVFSDDSNTNLVGNIYSAIFLFDKYISPLLKEEGFEFDELEKMIEKTKDLYVYKKVFKTKKQFLSGMSKYDLEEHIFDCMDRYKQSFGKDDQQSSKDSLLDVAKELERRDMNHDFRDFLDNPNKEFK